MPALSPLPTPLPLAELERRDRSATDPVLRSHDQIIWHLSGGRATAEVAHIPGYSEDWVLKLVQRYRQDGPAPDGGRWTGRQVAIGMSADLGRRVSPQRGWEYLRQLGCTPQPPRPTASQADPAAQIAFKTGGAGRR